MSRHLLLARHGQSTTNAANVFTGWSDPALTANGENEARAIADAIRRNGLEPKTIFSSNLSRARRSAEIVKEALGLPVQIQCSAALNERDYGKLTGCNKDEIAARYGRAKLQAWRRSWEAVPPGGESLRDTAARVLGHYVRSILPATLEQGSTLIVAHGNSLRALMIALEGVPADKAPDVQIGTGAVRYYDISASSRIVAARWLIQHDGVD